MQQQLIIAGAATAVAVIGYIIYRYRKKTAPAVEQSAAAAVEQSAAVEQASGAQDASQE